MKKTNRDLRPESQMMSHGYNPFWSEGAIKQPIFQTSTYEFASAAEGKEFFAKAYGKIDSEGATQGLIYSRINHPNLEIFENRLCLWDKTESCAAFSSGMAAITTTFMTFVKPREVILCSLPVYGGTVYFLENILPAYNIKTVYFYPNQSEEEINEMIDQQGIRDQISMIYVESPANPTNQLIDIEMCSRLAKQVGREKECLVAIDNTFMGPLWQRPKKNGADIILYSATKYIGGHSDLIAGAALGSKEHIDQIKGTRSFFGNMASAQTSWLLSRSLETLQVRMEKQAQNAELVASYLEEQPLVDQLFYLGRIQDEHQQEIFDRHFTSPGAMISFNLKGGEKEAFQFLDSLTLIKLAVSLGGTETLAEHPYSMTHTDMDEELKAISNVTENLIRVSIGVEHPQDLIDDLAHAFQQVQLNTESI